MLQVMVPKKKEAMVMREIFSKTSTTHKAITLIVVKVSFSQIIVVL